VSNGPKAKLECSVNGTTGWTTYCNNSGSTPNPQPLYWRVTVNDNNGEGGNIDAKLDCKNAAGTSYSVTATSQNPCKFPTACSYANPGSYSPQVTITKRGISVSNPKATATSSLILGGITCTGANPPDVDASLCTGSDQNLTGSSNLNRRLVPTCSGVDVNQDSNKCIYACNSSSTYDNSSGTAKCIRNASNKDWTENAP
jgi:hypothetical protein